MSRRGNTHLFAGTIPEVVSNWARAAPNEASRKSREECRWNPSGFSYGVELGAEWRQEFESTSVGSPRPARFSGIPDSDFPLPGEEFSDDMEWKTWDS
jgi:hypothetical protein